MQLNIKIAAVLIGFAFITGVAGCYYSVNNSRDILEQQIFHDLETNSISKADHVETVLAEYSQYTKTIATGNVFKDSSLFLRYFSSKGFNFFHSFMSFWML